MGRVRITPGFLLLAAGAFYLDEGIGLLPLVLLSAAAHEAGHYQAGRMFGGRLQWVKFSMVGAQMSLRYERTLSYGREIFVALAGPAVNLILGAAAAHAGAFLLAAASFGLGVFNLLPIYPLDGGRTVFLGLCALLGEDTGVRILIFINGGVVGLLAGIGMITAVYFSNFSLLIVTGWLLYVVLRQNRKKSREKGLLFED